MDAVTPLREPPVASMRQTTLKYAAEQEWKSGRPLPAELWHRLADADLFTWAATEQAARFPSGGESFRPPLLKTAAPAAAVDDVALAAPSAPRTIRRPLESSIFEGNISELPLWALTEKHAIPRVKVRDEKTGVGRLVVNEKALIRVVTLPEKTLEDGSVAQPHVEITANALYGFPTMFAARVLAIVLERARQRPSTFLESEVINISRYEIALRLGYKPSAIGRSTYESIERALDALMSTALHFRSSWYVKSSQKRANFVKATGLIAAYQFYDDRKERQAELPDLVPPDISRSYVRLSDVLLASLREGYYHGIDVDYLNSLSSPLAERLYLYLAKRDGDGRAVYKETLSLLATKVCIQATKPSKIWRDLELALKRLSTPLRLPTGTTRQFLRSYRYDKESQTVEAHFFTKKHELALQAAGKQGTLLPET